jgi:hypothetical protein
VAGRGGRAGRDRAHRLAPDGERVGPGWLLPAIEVVLLPAIVAGDPGRINRCSRLLRGLSVALVAVLVLGALSSTLLLIDALIHGGPETNSAGALLLAGTRVRVSNNLAFTNALAFSPTDVMPLVPWARVTMVVQSLISMGILALVVARAVNVFT